MEQCLINVEMLGLLHVHVAAQPEGRDTPCKFSGLITLIQMQTGQKRSQIGNMMSINMYLYM